MCSARGSPIATPDEWSDSILDDIDQATTLLNPVVAALQRVLAENPTMTALQVLDAAMADCAVHHADDVEPDFESQVIPLGSPYAICVDELEPPGALSEMIRRAFAPHLAMSELVLMSQLEEAGAMESNSTAAATATAWQRALLCFAERYRLWKNEPCG